MAADCRTLGADWPGCKRREKDSRLRWTLARSFPSFCLTALLFCPIHNPWGTLARTSKQPLYIHSPCASLQSLCPYIGPLSPLHVFEALHLSLSATVESSASFLSGWESSFTLKISNQAHFYRKIVKYFLRFSWFINTEADSLNILHHPLTEKETSFTVNAGKGSLKLFRFKSNH